MKTTLFVYSGTGNTFRVARKIADALGDTEIITLPTTRPVILTERVGILGPTANGIPARPVTDFIRNQMAKADMKPMQYLFSVVTCAGFPRYAPLVTELALQDIGCLASYTNTVTMNDNFLVLPFHKEGEKLRKLDAKADRKIEKIISDIKAEKMRVSGKKPMAKHMLRIATPARQKIFLDWAATRFSASSACTGCGTCLRHCPMGNISLKDGKPAFGMECNACYGCLLACPRQAILDKGKNWHLSARETIEPLDAYRNDEKQGERT